MILTAHIGLFREEDWLPFMSHSTILPLNLACQPLAFDVNG